MANIKSAEKRIKTSKARNRRNSEKKSKIKTLLKKIDLAETKEALEANLRAFFSQVDRAPRQVFHPNKVSRLKKQAAKKIAEKSGKI